MRKLLGCSALTLAIGLIACSGDDASGGSQSAGEQAGGDAGANGSTQPGGGSTADGGATNVDGGGGDASSGGGGNGDAGGPSPGKDAGGGNADSGGPPSNGSTGCGTNGGGPSGGPGDLFPCDSFWYKDVSNDAVDPASSGIIGGIGQWGTGKFQIDFSILFMHTDGSAPTQTFSLDYADESQTDPVPIPPGGAVEGETGYTCTGGGDCHLLVVDDGNKKLYELYAASDNNGSWHAAQESVWDLTKHYTSAGRGLGCTSADAAGLSVMAGLIGVRETKAGAINHAIRFILPNSEIRKGPSYVAPATHGTSATSSSSGPPYGTRLRLKSTFDETKVTSAGGKAVVRALKKYGMVLADGGQIALTAESDQLEVKKDPTMTWNGLLGAGDLAAIKPTDFDVVDFGSITNGGSCNLLP